MEIGHLPYSGLSEQRDRDSALPLVRVAVERSVEGDGLTYLSPWTDVRVGEQVAVPLGKARATGVVIARGGNELLDGLDRDRVRRILDRTGVAMSPDLVDLGRWISAYYLTPLGMVLASMVPGAVKRRTGSRTVELIGRGPVDAEAAILASTKLTPSARAAWDRIVAMTSDAGTMEAIQPRLLAASIGTTLAPINRLVAAGLLVRSEREEVRSRGFEPPARAEPTPDTRPVLQPEQAAAVEGIGQTLGAFGVHMLFGITGSGKTEVYLRLIDRVLERGATALVLVPEISLTPQTSRRFEARFGGRVAVLHSGLSASQRNHQWDMAASGVARVVVGARSAAFAPLANLGLIVVDEEHDGSYKQDTLPRYHGRDVAIKRAQMASCPVVLGSATPSLESWANATGPRAKYKLWKLTERAGAGKLPTVKVVDLAAEQPWGSGKPGAGGRGRGPLMIGATLRGALGRTLREGGQAILLLNRRGFATFMHCPSCKWTLSCDECDAAMVLHRSSDLPRGQVVRCHHCLAERLVPKACELCGNAVVALGVGTQRVEEELNHILAEDLPNADGALVRLDADTVRSVRELHGALERFGSGAARVLLGTQMIAKGLDYPNVRLVGVISADTALNLPDFRSMERTYQLVSQVAGRAGRGEHPGLVIVQTFSPATPAIRLAAAHDFEGFASMELRTRERACLPPAWRMARIVVRDRDHAKGAERARGLGEILRHAADREGGPERVRVDGPVPSAIARVEGWHRWDLLVRASTAGVVQRVLGAARAEGGLVSDAHTAVDVDPVSVM